MGCERREMDKKRVGEREDDKFFKCKSVTVVFCLDVMFFESVNSARFFCKTFIYRICWYYSAFTTVIISACMVFVDF